MANPIDRTGKKYGRLTAVSQTRNRNGKRYWKCVCDCGGKSVVSSDNLGNGQVRSCGCSRIETKVGEKNPMWLGDKISYRTLHQWVNRRKTKPKFCEICKVKKPVDLANYGGYTRDLENWKYLCRSCHMKEDGRINNLKQYEKVGK